MTDLVELAAGHPDPDVLTAMTYGFHDYAMDLGGWRAAKRDYTEGDLTLLEFEAIAESYTKL